MSETAKTDTPEMRYLLGELSEDEKTRMEEAFFADNARFAALELAEDDLIDAYVQNELSPEEHQQFYSTVLRSPRLRERVNFAQALAAKANSYSASEAKHSNEPLLSFPSRPAKPVTRWWWNLFGQQPAWRMAIPASAILVLVVGVVLVSGWLRLRNESQRLASERASLRLQKEELEKQSGEQRSKEQLAFELQRAREQHADDLKRIEELQPANPLKQQPTQRSALATIATVFLTPGSLRGSGGGQSPLIIRPETTAARVQLALENNDYPSYRVTLKTAEEIVVFRKAGLKPRNARSVSQLMLYIPFRLNTGDYTITASGRNPSGRYVDVDDYRLHVTTK